jgi:hypothetical protein
MPTIEGIMRGVLLKALISKAIQCPITGQLLDIRTAVVINDADGDPALVFSPAGWQVIENDPERMAALARHNHTKAQS